MKKITLRMMLFMIITLIGCTILINGCKSTEKVTSKIGAQLWNENCLRCHNAPDPADYSDLQWEVVGVHMKLRSNSLSDEEVNKIVEFMKSAN